MKVINITDKLSFEEKPQIQIKDTTLTVNNEAVAMLKILPKLNEDMTPSDMTEICEVLFEPAELKKLNKLKLNFKDFSTLLQSAISLVADSDEAGETLTPITT